MKDQKNNTVSLRQISTLMRPESMENDILVFSGRSYYQEVYTEPQRIEGLVVSLCTRGSAEVRIQEKEYKMTPGSLCIKAPGAPGDWNNISEDYDGFECVASMDFLKSLPFDLKNISAVFTYLKHEAFFRLSEKQFDDFLSIFRLIRGMDGQSELYRSRSREGIVVSLLYFICDLIHQRKADFEKELDRYQSKDRKHYYLLSFLELLGEYSNQERSVTFYADKLFLTPKYFSTVIKEVSGKSAGDWIDEYVMMEAKTLLQHSESNISETAYQLNFPNASFFGRYFKKHSGMSPGDYRRNYAFQ